MERVGSPVVVVSVAGDEVALGARHGALVRDLGEHQALVAFYRRLPERILAGGYRGAGRRLAIAALAPMIAMGMRRLDRARPTALRARSEAFLMGLGLTAREARAARPLMTVVDATQNTVGVLTRAGLAHDIHAAAGACSSFAAWGEASEDGRLLFARNFDLPGAGVWDRRPAVIFCTPTNGLRYGYIATVGADTPGVTAFNEAGIVLSSHTRFHRNVRFDGRAILDLGQAIAAGARTIAEAVAIARAAPIASSWGILVASAAERRAVLLETHAGGVAVVETEAGKSWNATTNRYRARAMQPGECVPSAAWVQQSDGRYAVMARRLEACAGEPMTVAGAMALLGSREAGDVPGWERTTGDTLCQSVTIQSVVVDVEGGAIWVGSGEAPTSLGPWTRVPMAWQGGLGVDRIAAPPAIALAGDDASRRAYQAYGAFMEATKLERVAAPMAAVEAAMARAVALAPEDPSYRHMAGALALRAGRPAEALAHFEAALEGERSPFRLGELSLWAGRAADAMGAMGAMGSSARARGHREAVRASQLPLLEEARRAARQDATRRYTALRGREVGLDFQLMCVNA